MRTYQQRQRAYRGRALMRDLSRNSFGLAITTGALLGLLCGLFI